MVFFRNIIFLSVISSLSFPTLSWAHKHTSDYIFSPFGYKRKSTICDYHYEKDKETLQAEVRTVSDGGVCTLPFQEGKDNYLSFGVIGHPLHGKIFLYNDHHVTYIDYTANKDYKGDDHFDITLFSSNHSRKLLKVTLSIEEPEDANSEKHPLAPPKPF